MVEENRMDLIGGIAAITAVFLIAAAVVAHWVAGTPWSAEGMDHRLIEQIIQRRAQTTFVTLLIGFFVGIADVLVAAQLPAIAFLNVIVGGAAIVILYSVARQRRADKVEDTWRT
jgi:hypothetical protein